MLYSPLKIFHHRDRLDALARGEQPSPCQVQLIITNRCNNRCKFCAYRMNGYPSNQKFHEPDEIPFAKVEEILDDCQTIGVGAIQITGGGEPSIHPQFSEITASVIVRGLDLAVVTNGNAIPAEAIETLAQAKWVRFSIDAGHVDTYRQLRHTSSRAYANTWRTILALVDAKRLLQTDVVIGVGFVVTRENYLEVIHLTKAARDAGVDNVRISAVFQNQGAEYFADFRDEAERLCAEAAGLQTPSFRVFNNFDARVDDLVSERPDYRECGIQHFDTYIGADLNVYRCCVTAYNARGLVGSIRERRFVDLWTSEEKRLAFDTFDARGCKFCMFNDKNRTIAYAISANPPHVNFV